MSDNLSQLRKKSLILLFAYAPFGFGHLRVTDTLYHGLPKEVNPLLLGSHDRSLTVLYRFMSIHPVARVIMENMQRGIFENIFSDTYRWFLRSNTKNLYQQMETIIEQRLDIPETVLVIATHFGLAHQLASIKNKLEKEKRVKIVLIVQVTDDSPQHIWYVDGADMIFVPSEKTKAELIHYGKHNNLPSVRIEMIPYPVNPYLSRHLSEEKYQTRLKQVNPENKALAHIVLPVSGAAVGINFYIKLIDEIQIGSQQYFFHVIAKAAMYTQPFLNEFIKRSSLKLYTSAYDRVVLDNYEDVYDKNVIALEVTKPSEQAFKALLRPTQVGGSILLFAEPVGRQEYDNLDFLRRHHLIPKQTEQAHLWVLAEKNTSLEDEQSNDILEKATHWRGICLPHDPMKTAHFINWCFHQKIFFAMMQYKSIETDTSEIEPNGVHQFWTKVSDYLNEIENYK